MANSVDTTAIIDTDSKIVDNLELSWGTDRVNIKEAMTKIAGVTGKVTWYYDIAPKDNPDVFTVDGVSVNTDNPAKRDSLELSLLVNGKTGVFKVTQAKKMGNF